MGNVTEEEGIKIHDFQDEFPMVLDFVCDKEFVNVDTSKDIATFWQCFDKDVSLKLAYPRTVLPVLFEFCDETSSHAQLDFMEAIYVQVVGRLDGSYIATEEFPLS